MMRGSVFEIQPPGSFPLCVELQFQADAARDLQTISDRIRQATRSLTVFGLILTGSVARGEGTLVADPVTGNRWMGDLECVVVVPKRQIAGEVDQLLRNLEVELSSDLTYHSRGLKIGLTPMPLSRLRHLRPSIFNREFLEHGKLLWGKPKALALPEWWRQGAHEVPRRDAFRLLNNRIIQQIATRMRHETADIDPVAAEYSISKLWIELATSLSVFLDCYRSSYLERQNALEDVFVSRQSLFDVDFQSLFIARLKESMSIKFGRRPTDLCHTSERFEEVARAAARIWFWETASMLGADRDDCDWTNVISRLRGLETPRQRLRDWMRFFTHQKILHGITPAWVRSLCAVMRAGSFANAIYATGCLLEFHWEAIADEISPGPQIVKTLQRFFDSCAGSGRNQRMMLTRSAHSAWDTHLRSAAV